MLGPAVNSRTDHETSEPSENADSGIANSEPIAEPSRKDAQLGATSRSVISFLLVVHLFAVGICIQSVLPTSDLGARLLTIFTPYNQLMHFDLEWTPYYLTRETLNSDTLPLYEEREYLVEYLPSGAEPSDPAAWRSIVAEYPAGTAAKQRSLRYATAVAAFSEDDQVVSRFVRDIASHLVSDLDEQPRLIRVRQHRPVPRQRYYATLDDQPDPLSPTYYVTRYTAEVIVQEDGDVNVMKYVSAAEAASVSDSSDVDGDK